jgi:hypothetical protein
MMKKNTGMVTRNRVIAAASAVVVVVVAALAGVFLGLEGNSSGTAKPGNLVQAARTVDEALVTGYASSPLTGRPSGPVSVVLRGASAARIDALVQGLQVDNSTLVCAEEAQLYQINFAALAGVKQGSDVMGYQCGGLVVVTSGGKTVTRIDRNCALLAAVRRLLPETATATQRLIAPCAS